MMKCLTNKGRVPFWIDDSDYPKIKDHKWHMRGRYPATATGAGSEPLHLFLLGRAPDGLEWDHIDRNPCNNRRGNLRAVTHSVNMRNTDRYDRRYDRPSSPKRSLAKPWVGKRPLIGWAKLLKANNLTATKIKVAESF
jgi:hypothetical protein